MAKDQQGLDAHFTVLVEEGISGLIVFDLKGGHCLYANRVARETMEIPSEKAQLSDFLLSQIIPTEDKPGFGRKLTRELIQSKGYYPDVYFLRSNGHTVFANVDLQHVTIQNAADHTQSAVVISFQDITLQKKLQRDLQMKQDQIHSAYEELLVQNRQLLELDQAKDKFVALTTHELRTPLSAIVAMTEALVLGFEESPEQHKEFLQTVHEQSLHLMNLVNDILDFAKIRAGKMDYYVENLDLRRLLELTVQNFQSMAEQAKLTFQMELPPQPVMAFADQMRLREVIDNVVNNAIKYNRAGGKVRVHVSAISERIRISVADNGKGIPADQISKVFNEFETLNSVSQHHKGTGLGMPISKNLMTAMGGELTLTSEVGVGTEFHIDIPTAKVLGEEFYRERPDSWGDFAA